MRFLGRLAKHKTVKALPLSELKAMKQDMADKFLAKGEITICEVEEVIDKYIDKVREL